MVSLVAAMTSKLLLTHRSQHGDLVTNALLCVCPNLQRCDYVDDVTMATATLIRGGLVPLPAHVGGKPATVLISRSSSHRRVSYARNGCLATCTCSPVLPAAEHIKGAAISDQCMHGIAQCNLHSAFQHSRLLP